MNAASTLTVMIVDDEAPARSELKFLLDELGQTEVVAEAASVREAIEKLKEYPCDVMFLDVNMPILSGLEALPRIRAASPQTAVVMVTGNATRELVQQAAGLGACGYVVKPVRPAYVQNFLNKLFKR